MKIALICRKESDSGNISDYKLETLFRAKYILLYDTEEAKVKIYELKDFEKVGKKDKGPALAFYVENNIGKIDVLGTADHELEISGYGEKLPWKENVKAGAVNDGAQGAIERLVKKYGKDVKKGSK